MANIIRRSDISEEDLFKDVRDSAVKTQGEIQELNDELNETAQILNKEVKSAKFVDTASINKSTKAFKKSNTVKKQAVELEKQMIAAKKIEQNAEIQLERIKREKLKTESQEIRNKQQLAREAERLARVQRKQVKNLEEERNEYKKLVKSTREFKNESKRLAANLIKLEQSGRRNTKEFRELSAEYKHVTRNAQQADKTLKKIDATVGDNFRNVGNYTQVVGKLRGALGQLGLAFGAFTILKGAGQTVVEFDKQVQNLASITGASGEDLKFFKEQAIEMGKEVNGGASGVIEAYKLIGSARPELLKNSQALNQLTEEAILLSQASGLDLPDAAMRLTDAMNQFNIPVSEASKLVNTLANASLEGSAAIPEVTDALLKFGAIAEESNVSVEESAALIEVLASKGLKGAEAGTKLRNVMLKLSAPDALPKEARDMMQDLGISFEDIADPSKSFAERLEALGPLLKDKAALTKVFGAENELAAINLIKGTDEIERLTDAMEDQTTAQKQAEQNTQTLEFAFNKLKESWNALILEFNEGSGASTLVRDSLLFIAQNLGTILSILGKAVLAWGIYKAAIMSVRTANFIMSGGIKDTIKGMGRQIKSLKNVGKQAKTAGNNIKGAGKAMTSIPWVALIGFALELAVSWYDVASGAKAAREASEAVEKIQEKAAKRSAKRSQDRSEALQKEMTENERKFRREEIDENKLRELNEEAIKVSLELAKADRKLVDGRARSLQENIDTVESLGKAWNGTMSAISSGQSDRAGEAVKNLGFKEMGQDLKNSSVDLNEYNKMITISEGKVSAAWKSWHSYDEEIKVYNDLIDEAKTRTFETNKQTNEQEDNTKKLTGATRKLNTEFSDQIDRLKTLHDAQRTYIKNMNEIRDLQVEASIGVAEDNVETEFDNQFRSAETTGEINVDELERLIDVKAEIQRQAVIDQADFESNEATKNFEDRFNNLERNLIKEREKLLSQKGLTESQISEIEKGYQREREDLRLLRIEEQKNLDQELEIIHLESAEAMKDIDREVNDEKNDVNDELIQEQINYYARQDELRKEERDKQLEADRKLAADRKAIAQSVTDFLIKKSNERIAQADKELAEAETEANRLQQLADNGNIKAEESLAEQNRIIAEAEKKKLEELQFQQRIQLVNAGLQTYNSKVEAGSDAPLAETVRDIALLQQFLSSIPAFYEGTDTTVASALGAPDMKGRDGYVVRVDGNEKILNPSLSEMTGNMSTSEIAQVSQDYRNGKLVNRGEGAVQIGNGWNTSQVVKKLDSLEQTIKNKPETAYNFEQLSDRLFAILKTQKHGNTLIHTKYRQDT